MAMQEDTELPRRRARHLKVAIVASGLAVLVLLWTVVAISVWFARQGAFERARSNAANLTAAFSEELTHTLDNVNAAMELIAGKMRAGDSNVDMQAWARDVPLMAVGTIQGSIIGPDGQLVSSTLDPHPKPMDLSDRAHFRVHLDGSYKGLFISAPVIGRVSKEATIQVSKRVDSDDGRFLGVLVFSLPPRNLTTLNKLMNIGERGVIALTGLDDIVRARFTAASPDGLVGIGQSLAGGSRPSSFPVGAEGNYIRAGVVDGVNRVLHYQRLRNYPLVVTVGFDLDEVLAPATAQTWVMLGVACVGTLLLGGLAAWLVREIEQRAEREIEVANGRMLLQDAVDSVSEGFVIYDRDDRLIVLNEAYRALFGAPVNLHGSFEDLVRQGLSEGRFLDAAGREEGWLAERLRRHRECGEPIEHKMAGGRWVLATDRRMRNGGIVGLRIDITALKEVQAALRESEERLTQNQQHLALAQAVSHVGSVIRDLKTDTVEWSDELYRILGIEPGSVSPGLDALMDFVHPDDRAAVLADRDAALRGESQKLSEYRILRRDGAVRVVERTQRTVHDEQGNPRHFLVVFRDVTQIREADQQRHTLERQLHHSQKLESLGTLAGGIAHDLNNTLVPIITIAKLRLNEAKPGTTEYEDLDLICRGGVRARDLVRQVLAFSRKDVADRRLFEFNDLLDEALAMLRPTIPAMIRIEVNSKPVPAILGDPTQMMQVIVNLMTNAVHAIGMQHGSISISLEPIAATPTSEPGFVRFTMSDTGCGMDEETQRRIFDPFFTTKAVGQGTGLGLSVVHGIVASHGGTISVQSAPGRGACFAIDLPLAARRADGPDAEQRRVA